MFHDKHFCQTLCPGEMGCYLLEKWIAGSYCFSQFVLPSTPLSCFNVGEIEVATSLTLGLVMRLALANGTWGEETLCPFRAEASRVIVCSHSPSYTPTCQKENHRMGDTGHRPQLEPGISQLSQSACRPEDEKYIFVVVNLGSSGIHYCCSKSRLIQVGTAGRERANIPVSTFVSMYSVSKSH